MVDYKLLDYYDELFNDYYNHIKDNVDFEVDIIKKSPPQIVKFPTIRLKEVNDVSSLEGTATNYLEIVDTKTYQIDIYTKDLLADNKQIPSLEVQKILKQLTYNFFMSRNFERTNSDSWENMNIVYDRLTLLFRGRLQSWNKQIV